MTVEQDRFADAAEVVAAAREHHPDDPWLRTLPGELADRLPDDPET